MKISDDIIKTIAQNLMSGEQCHIHKKTCELISFPNDELLDLDPELNVWKKDIKKVASDSGFVEIHPMSSHDSFMVMEDFVNSLNDRSAKISLLRALDGKKPFARFKNQIEASPFRNLWFEFRDNKLFEWVQSQVSAI
jgi:hypothetical protein